MGEVRDVRRWVRPVIVVAVLLVSACSRRENDASTVVSGVDVVPAVTSSPTPPTVSTAIGVAPPSTAAVMVTVAALPAVVFPAVAPEVAAATLVAAGEVGLFDWLTTANAAISASAPPCDPAAVMLSADEFDAAAQLADEVTGELIANLDASLGAAAERCRRAEVDLAAVELADAAATADLLEQRLAELGR